MPITPTLTLKTGSTYAPTGGTDTVYTEKGFDKNGILVLEDSTAGLSLVARPQLTFGVKNPQRDVKMPGGYSHARASGMYKLPVTLADGSSDVFTAQVIFSFSNEATGAQLDILEEKAIQLSISASLADFRRRLALA